ncbi:MAG: hypothetical protein CXT67_09890 [Methanobacteriota archaeon]|nr:MAG: hypothetical protein CXT67_09890 [Euryarchaeota archaeon]
MKFKEIKFRSHGVDPEGVHGVVRFRNGYGLSIVRHSYSYGGDKGLYELALLKIGTLKGASQENDWDIVYNEELGYSDVLGWMSEEDVENELHKIENAPKFSEAESSESMSFAHAVPESKS